MVTRRATVSIKLWCCEMLCNCTTSGNYVIRWSLGFPSSRSTGSMSHGTLLPNEQGYKWVSWPVIWIPSPTTRMSAAIILAIVALAVFTLKKYLDNRKYHRLPFPPGPKPWPIIGNALDLTMSAPWVSYAKWSKVYGTFSVAFCVTLFHHSYRPHKLCECARATHSNSKFGKDCREPVRKAIHDILL